ncbi:MAG: hypothetical protein JRG91_07710 [Deltaproteobacteria bacterium]|nr:hypothetical protein [Deltaproteobacteria bacterium]
MKSMRLQGLCTAIWAVWIPACGGGAKTCGDEIAPEVTSADALFVEPGAAEASYSLTFGEAVDGVDAGTVTFTQTRGSGSDTTIEITAGAEADAWTVLFSPSLWQPGDRFTLTISEAIHDACDNSLGGDFVVAVSPYPEAGTDLDETSTRTLSSPYTLPDEFYAALETMGLPVSRLDFPDAGSTYETTPTRLHWTDTLRHEGDTAPTFAYMVAGDVESALGEPDDQILRELLAAQHGYNVREAFTTVRFDERYVMRDVDGPLLAALRAFYEHDPVQGHPSPPTRAWEEIESGLAEQAGAFPFETRAALALAIRGLVRAAELRDEALLSLGWLGMDQWQVLHEGFVSGGSGYSTYTHEFGSEGHTGFVFESMARAGQLALRSVESLRLSLADADPVSGARIDLEGPLGRITVTMEDAADTWSGGGWFLLVDGGGDDTYLDGVATNTTIHLPVSVVLDLAGDDTYRSTDEWDISEARVPGHVSCMQGAGIFGVAILDDAQGADDYHAGYVAQGAGIFGVGVLADHGGSDRYRGYSNCQGSADFGYGLLVDLGGTADEYETLQRSQGYGGPRGMGWLVDDGGDDTYLAIAEPLVVDWAGEGSNWSGSQGFGYGVRDGFFTPGAPIFSGGLGGLFDLDGNDDYQCAVMCQGFGYAFGTGLFYDPRGDDDHLVTHKYAMGAATHWAVGVFIDGEGSDTYRNSGDDECIGLGYDASPAFHIDRGDQGDVYTIDNIGAFVLGVGRIPGLGVLINEGGDDEYHVPGGGERSVGRSYTASGNRGGYLATVPNVGMFLDLGGTADTYDFARVEAGNGLEWIQTDPQGDDWDPAHDFGYGLDTE